MNKEWIDVARKIVEESQKVIAIAQMVTEACTDIEMKKVKEWMPCVLFAVMKIRFVVVQALQQVISKIHTISTQLKMLASVKAGDSLGTQHFGFIMLESDG